MAVVNVSRKKSRALMIALAAAAPTDDRGVDGDEDGRPVRRRVGVGDGAADRAPVADLRVADEGRRLLEHRVVVADDRVLVDLPMGRPGADAQVVVGLDDGVHAVDVAQVDEQGRLREPELDQGDEAVAAGEELGLALAVLEDPQRLVQVRRTDVVELAGDHRALPSSPLARGDEVMTRRRGGSGAVATFAGRAVGCVLGTTGPVR